jgi:hypothetical protein
MDILQSEHPVDAGKKEQTVDYHQSTGDQEKRVRNSQQSEHPVGTGKKEQTFDCHQSTGDREKGRGTHSNPSTLWAPVRVYNWASASFKPSLPLSSASTIHPIVWSRPSPSLSPPVSLSCGCHGQRKKK